MRGRIDKSKWIRIGLGSIALHLVLISFLTAAPKTQSVYTIDVEYLRHIGTEIRSGTTQTSATHANSLSDHVSSRPVEVAGVDSDSHNTLLMQSYQMKAHQQILEQLQRAHIRGAEQLALLIEIHVADDGKIIQANLRQTSGRSEFDRDVVDAIRSLTLTPPPTHETIKLLVPIKLI